MDRSPAAVSLLEGKLDRLSQKRIDTDLAGVLPAENLPGLEHVIRASVSRIIQRMQTG
jgi:hypothetical protein